MSSTSDKPGMEDGVHPFDVDTGVEAISEHRFTATTTDRWDALGGGANGGYLLAVALRALGEVMPLPDPVVVSAFFMRPGRHGPGEVEAEVVRAGRRLATGEAHLFQGDKEVVRLLATFADLGASEGRTLMLNEPPGLPPPEDSIDPLAGAPIPGLTIAERVDYRMAKSPGWSSGHPTGEGSNEFWMRFQGGREPDLLSLAFFVDAAAPAVLELGEVASTTVELSVHLRGHPAPGWLACRHSTRHVMGGFHEEDFEIWDSKGQLVAQSRQLALLP